MDDEEFWIDIRNMILYHHILFISESMLGHKDGSKHRGQEFGSLQEIL